MWCQTSLGNAENSLVLPQSFGQFLERCGVASGNSKRDVMPMATPSCLPSFGREMGQGDSQKLCCKGLSGPLSPAPFFKYSWQSPWDQASWLPFHFALLWSALVHSSLIQPCDFLCVCDRSPFSVIKGEKALLWCYAAHMNRLFMWTDLQEQVGWNIMRIGSAREKAF